MRYVHTRTEHTMTAAEFLVQKGILRSTDLETLWNLNLSRDTHVQTVKNIINAMDEYAAAYHDQKVKEIEDQTEPYKGHIRV